MGWRAAHQRGSAVQPHLLFHFRLCLHNDLVPQQCATTQNTLHFMYGDMSQPCTHIRIQPDASWGKKISRLAASITGYRLQVRAAGKGNQTTHWQTCATSLVKTWLSPTQA
jgi:hypothetical protein